MLRLRQVALVARELEPVVAQLQEQLGLEVAHRDPAVAVFGLHNAVMPVGNQFLEVVAPTREGTAAGRYLDRRGGDGGYMVILQCDRHADHKRRIAQLGIRTALEQDSETYHLLQLHPADTGGSFLEIDEQIGGEDLDGPWEPAGDAWRAALRTEVVSGIAAAEIESPEPERLAQRWSEILDVPVDEAPDDDSGVRSRLQLDNAALLFVEAVDGRGEGLGAIDVIASEPSNDVLLIGGIHIRFVPA